LVVVVVVAGVQVLLLGVLVAVRVEVDLVLLVKLDKEMLEEAQDLVLLAVAVVVLEMLVTVEVV